MGWILVILLAVALAGVSESHDSDALPLLVPPPSDGFPAPGETQMAA